MPNRHSTQFFPLLIAAAIATFILIAAGNAVRVVEAAPACPDWPTCYGAWLPPAGTTITSPLGLNMAHRAAALLATVLVAVSAGWALFLQRTWLVKGPLAAAAAIMVFESLMGAGLAQQPASWRSGFHMAAALLVLGLVAGALVVEFALQAKKPLTPTRLSFRAPFARKTVTALVGLFVLLMSGVALTALGAGQDCTGFPLCAGGLPETASGWVGFSHRLVVLSAGGLLVWQFFSAWKSQRSQIVVLPAASAVFVLLIGQSFLGMLHTTRGFPGDLVWLHAATSAALWAAQVVTVISAGLSARTAEEEAAEAAEPLPLRQRAKDFLILSKPIIVLLLLVTTYAGMVVGGGAIPSAGVTFWTLLGGALAAGGASALNQYIDRETDGAMQRTAKRPLPDKRLKPPEGLAYGIAACLTAFFLMAGMVNLLSALLSLAGMIYYVLLYSMWLKHATVQNIVIGGGAGAIPPLVGWAAASGSLNVPALFLFAIIFLWTPPHFWALALVRRNDYARGKVPMLPVVRGEGETRKQIMIYTLELVALTLLLPAFQLLGAVYLVSAVVLGLWLIATAWNVYRKGGNKLAWKMYRYSSMYLAFLMLAMVVDVLI